MKNAAFILVAVAAGHPMFSAPFDPSRIAEDTKWVAHLDVDAYKNSSFGTYLVNWVRDEIIRKQTGNLSVDLDAVLQEVHSITAYGTTFENQPENHSVLMIQTGDKGRAIIDGFLASQELAGEGKSPFKLLTGKAFTSYVVENEVFLTFPRKDLIMISKEFSQVERAMAVIEGRAPRISRKNPVMNMPAGGGYYFFASADGLNQLENIPPQARILQKATGVRIGLGERAENLLANVTLSTNGADVSRQLKQIVEGMLALVSFAQVDNQSLSKLTQNIAVNETENAVSINLAYPSKELSQLVMSLFQSGGKLAADNGRRRAQPTSPEDMPVTDATGGARLTIMNVDASGDDGNLPRMAKDDNLETWWGAEGRNTWIRFELEGPSVVREVQLAFRNGDERTTRFTIQASPDGRKWTNLVRRTTSGQTRGFENWNVPDTAARFIRVQSTSQTPNRMMLSEARIIGEAGATLPAAPGPEAVSAPSRN